MFWKFSTLHILNFHDLLSFSKKLYLAQRLMTNEDSEKQILSQFHPDILRYHKKILKNSDILFNHNLLEFCLVKRIFPYSK